MTLEGELCQGNNRVAVFTMREKALMDELASVVASFSANRAECASVR